MKERTFYTINLDITRIIILLCIIFGFMAYFFFLGRITVKDKSQKENVKPLVETKDLKPIPKLTEEGDYELPPVKGSETIELKPAVDPSKSAVPPVLELKEEDSKSAKNAELVKEEAPPTLPKAKRQYYKKKTKKKENLELIEEKNLYSIQLGAFSSQEQAMKYKDSILKKNQFVKNASPIVQKNANYFIVTIGKSNSKEKLEGIIQNLDPVTQSKSMIIVNQKP